jgi:uncharacterized coiled-coil DUF342 family protein
MTEPVSTDLPLEIDRLHGSRSSAGEIRLVVTGRWPGGPPGPAEQDALLVIQVEGRRHRFAPDPGGLETDARLHDGGWTATFTIPAWAEPRREGQAALWMGSSVIPLPTLHASQHEAPPALASAIPAPPPGGGPPPPPQEPSTMSPPPAPVPGLSLAAVPGAPEARRSGPLADVLLKETVAALHAELEQRAAEAARLRGALADTQSELEARVANQAQLEVTLGELGVELRRLMEAVEEQQQELNERSADREQQRAESQQKVAELKEAHEAAQAELRASHEAKLAELTAARDQHLAELATLREQVTAATAGAQERDAELARVREQLGSAVANADQRGAESSALREELAAANVSRDAAIGEVAGLRDELARLGSELAATRERVDSESGDLGEANRLLADAKALADRLRAERAQR